MLVPCSLNAACGDSFRSGEHETLSDTSLWEVNVNQVFCPILVGRRNEIAAIEAAIRNALQGKGSMIVASGEAGIGKSRLAREAETLAAQAGMQIARGRALDGTDHSPYRPIVEALQSLLRRASDPGFFEPYQPMLGALLPEMSGARGARPDSELVVADAVMRLLRDLAAENGLLLVLEDLHWADLDTLSVLEYFADNVSDERIVCLCTERTAWPGPAADRLAALVSRRSAIRLSLERLSDVEVVEMVKCTLDVETVSQSIADALTKRSEGVPFLVEEMLSAYLSLGGHRERTPEWWLALQVSEALPPSYRELVSNRMSNLERAANEVVTAAAVLGRTFEWPLLGPITSQSEEQVLAGLRGAVLGQLLIASPGIHPETFSFRHALARETVIADLLPSERAKLSLKAADVIEDLRPGVPGDWCDRVADLREQGEDRVGAVRLLIESGRRALRRGALATAEATLTRARELAGNDYTLWLGIDELLAEVLSRSGKTERLIEMTSELLAFFEEDIPTLPGYRYGTYLSPTRLARFHLYSARACFLAGEAAMAEEFLDKLWGTRSEIDEEVLADAHALAAQLAISGGNLRKTIVDARVVLKSSDEDRETSCEALDALGRALWLQGDHAGARSTFERMTEIGNALNSPIWRSKALLELGTIESAQSGEVVRLHEARALAASTGAVSTLALADLQIGWNQLFLGAQAEAKESIESALDTCRRFALRLLPHVLVAQGALFALADDASAMEDAIRAALDRAPESREVAARVHGNCRALLWIVRDKRDSVLAELELASKSAGGAPVGKSWWAGLVVLLKAMSGDWEPTTKPAPTEFPNPTSLGCALYAVAVALGRSGEAEAALLAFQEADSVMPPGWPRHRARCLAAEAAYKNRWGRPQVWVSEALAYYENRRIEPLASSARSLARNIGVTLRRKGRGASVVPSELERLGITSREMDVLILVAEGLSNPEIAERLFLSPRTVETHVRSLMRRSGTESRAQLVAFAVRRLAAGVNDR